MIEVTEIIERRLEAVRSLHRSLGHLSFEQQMYIVTGYIPLIKLEHIARIQEKKENA